MRPSRRAWRFRPVLKWHCVRREIGAQGHDLDTSGKLSVEWTAIRRLYCSPANPRRNEEAVPHVAASLRRFGWQQPIVARPTGEVVAGNTRLKAAQSLGLT